MKKLLTKYYQQRICNLVSRVADLEAYRYNCRHLLTRSDKNDIDYVTIQLRYKIHKLKNKLSN